jgi:hypothetical protein
MTSRQAATGEIAKKTKTLLKNSAAKPQPAQGTASETNGLRGLIADRAYALFEERGYRQGGDLQDWLDAEREILSRQLPA